jgi:hypothetical protein
MVVLWIILLMVSTIKYKQESEIDLKKVDGSYLANLELAENMIVKQEDFETKELVV